MEVVRDLTCPICLEFYSHPVILPCSHMMCKQPCAEQLFEGNFIRCPVCRDNCYVSGGLSSLPRVITIESIIEKVRAERKKRNASSHGQTKESSFDDVFSDVTSDNRGSDGTPVSSASSTVPFCNSPNFPEERPSPINFSPREAFNNLGSISNVLLRSIPPQNNNVSHLSSTLTPISPEESTPRNLIRGCSSTEDSSHLPNLISPQHTVRHNNGITPTPPFAHHTFNTQCEQFLPLSSSYPSTEASNNTNHFTTDILHHNPILSQVTETHCVNRRSRQTSSISNSQFIPESTVSQQTHTVRFGGFTSSINHQEMNPQTDGASSEAFATDQLVQTSTPRSDLRNIRFCHEQSLANLKACSDSIRALQQSRPFFRNNQSDSSFSVTDNAVSTTRNNDCLNESEETRSFWRHVNDILFDSSGSDGSPRMHQADERQTPSPDSQINQYTSQLNNSASTIQTPQSYQNFERNQSDSNSNLSSGNVAAINPLVSNGGHELRTHGYDDTTEVSSVKLSIQNNLQKLCDIQNQLLFHMNSFTEKAAIGEDKYDKGRSDINKECDSLVAEIENKRYHFLLHIDDERKKRRLETNDTTVAMQRLLASSQELSLFVEEMLESRPQTILSTASSLLDSLSSAVAECQTCLQTSTDTNADDTESSDCNGHLIDTRLQRHLVQGLNYLSLPDRPVFCVESCTRNTTCVALVLQPPVFGNAIDHYEIIYCSEEQKALGIEERYYAKMADDPDLYGGINPEVIPIILIENLCQSTHYFFCACAVNRKGKSPTSDYVQCKTLAHRDCVVPVPSVIENRCQVSATSVNLTCPSLATVTSHQRVNHCLLQRTENGACVWKGVELTSKKEEISVKKLRPETPYNFAVIAYNGRGECQLSNVVGLKTQQLEQFLLDSTISTRV